MSVFDDQAQFMRASGQTVGTVNKEQWQLYLKLITEEVTELMDSQSEAEAFKELIDIITVCVGAGHSRGWPMQEGWEAVLLSNLRKIDPETGTVQLREDGKVLKPASWRAPDMAKLLGAKS